MLYYEVFLEDYHRRIHIEGEVALEIATSMIYPAVAQEYTKLVAAAASGKAAGVKSGVKALTDSAAELGAKLDELKAKSDALRKALGGLHEEILTAMADLRVVVDSIEKNVSDECWPLPKYREMLFVY